MRRTGQGRGRAPRWNRLSTAGAGRAAPAGIRAWAIGKNTAVQARRALVELGESAIETVVVW